MPRLSGDDQPAVDAVEDDLDPARLACPPAGRGDVDQTAAGQKATDGIRLGGVARLARSEVCCMCNNIRRSLALRK
jgi:hypothetical protein